MARRLLDVEEIRNLDALYLDVHGAALRQREAEPLARYLSLPRLPEALSVSVAALCGPRLVGARLSPGRDRHDLETPAGDGVAVKGVGLAGWFTLTDTDRRARSLILVDYGPRLDDRTDQVILRAYEMHGTLRQAPTRLTRAQLGARATPRRATRWAPKPST